MSSRTAGALAAAATLLAACTCAEESAPDAGAVLDAGPDASPLPDAGLDSGADAGSPGPCDDPCPGALSCCSDGRVAECLDLGTDPRSCGGCGVRCPDEAPVCLDAACVPCEEVGQTTCAGACVSLEIDGANCGACGNACGEGEQCIAGSCQGGDCELACVVIEGEGGVCCSDEEGRPSCTDLRNDSRNCGACGTFCGPAGRCDGGPGRCVCDEEPGRVARCGDECRSVADDEQNCGDCGVVCPADAPVCREGRCIDCAVVGLDDCGFGDCVDLDTDERHCGGCGDMCAPDQECLDRGCIAGDCALGCDAALDRGPLCCDDAWGQGPGCTSLLEDPRNCGGCGQDCGEAALCEDGICRCPEGGDVALCDGVCVDLDANAAHCGGCGNACPPDAPRCVDAACTSCEDSGLADCGGPACTDTSRDALHCGACGVPCGAGEQCVQGACVGGDCGLCDEDVGVCCEHPAAQARPGCTDLSTDAWNCGACGVWCDAGEVCDAGLCV